MLSRFESILEHAVQGTVRRVLPAPLQPVQLAKAAARAMEDSRVIGIRGPEVPNLYVLALNPRDLERFSSYRETLAAELASYLSDYAQDRALRPVGDPRVEITEDGSIPDGQVHVDASFIDIQPARQQALESLLEGTRGVRVGKSLAGGVSAQLDLDEGGAPLDLGPEIMIVRMGRAVDNDVVLNSQRVSRYHAQLRRTAAVWTIEDLSSTNGTYVDERPVEGGPQLLRAEARLRLGDRHMVFRTNRPPGSGGGNGQPARTSGRGPAWTP